MYLFSCYYITGQSKSNITPQSLQTEKLSRSSQSTQISLNKVHEPSFYPMDKSKVDLWRERAISGVEISEKIHDSTNNKHLESSVASHVRSPYPVPPASDLAKSWPHSVSSWEKPSSSLNHKSLSVQTYPDLNSSVNLSKSSQSSVHSDLIFGDRWYLNSNTRSNPGFGSELPYRNGFHQGSSSASKELQIHFSSLRDDCLCSSNENNGAPGHSISHGSAKHYKGSNCADMKSVKDMNLNVVVLNSSSNQEIPRQGFEVLVGDQKHEDPLAVLPWLKAKPMCKNEASNLGTLSKIDENIVQSSKNQSFNKSDIAKDSSHLFTQHTKSVSSANDLEAKRIEPSDCPSNRKLLGFPIFDKPRIAKNETTLASPSISLLPPSECKVESNRVHRLLDINLPCDPAVPDLIKQKKAENLVTEKEMDTKSAGFRQIDLNSCLSDDEASLKPMRVGMSAKTTTIEIDLEAPAVPETEDDDILVEGSAVKHQETPLAILENKAELPQDQLLMIAAEAIVAISSSSRHNHVDDSSCNSSEEAPLKEHCSKDPLAWFVEIVSSYGDDFDGKFDVVLRSKESGDSDEYSSESVDYFESMTLKLMEIKEEDYMPMPLVPENLKLEETGTSLLSTRSRKGQARRGRQRRDFQRDILPGLASLSRHEVTEDLQTFGGLMRATGHAWHSGLARRNSTRNGCARGRRRAVVSASPPALVATTPACSQLIQQLNNIEIGLEDRSLTGWGKTTRRPRRQRCPAVNPPSIALT